MALLASVGSTAAFVGLFGMVWEIYAALVRIGASGQASTDWVGDLYFNDSFAPDIQTVSALMGQLPNPNRSPNCAAVPMRARHSSLSGRRLTPRNVTALPRPAWRRNRRHLLRLLPFQLAAQGNGTFQPAVEPRVERCVERRSPAGAGGGGGGGGEQRKTAGCAKSAS